MTTKLIGIKDFRRNLTRFSKETRTKGVHFIVMRHSVPLMRVSPMTQEELDLEELRTDVAQAREDLKRGKGRSSAEVRAMLGL